MVYEILRVKEELIGLARRSRSRELKRDIVPPVGSTRKQGPDYNGRLSGFVQNYWSLERASQHSPSLHRAQEAFLTFKPVVCPLATP